MYDFTGSLGGDGWGVSINTGGYGYGGYPAGYPSTGYPTTYPTTYPVSYGGIGGLNTMDPQTKQLLLLGAIVVVAVLLTK